MKLRTRAAVVATSATMAVALALTGCTKLISPDTGQSTATTTNLGQPEAVNLVKQSEEAMRRVTGLHMSLVTQGKLPINDPLYPGCPPWPCYLKVSRADADVSNTPQSVANGNQTVSLDQKTVDAKFVYVDAHLYSDVADPGTFTDYGNYWTSLYDVTVVLDRDEGIANMLSELGNPTVAGSEQIDGIATTKITGTSNSNVIAGLGGSQGSEQVFDVPTAVWISIAAPNYPIRVQIEPRPGASVTLTLSEWNKRVTATKPSVAAGR